MAANRLTNAAATPPFGCIKLKATATIIGTNGAPMATVADRNDTLLTLHYETLEV